MVFLGRGTLAADNVEISEVAEMVGNTADEVGRRVNAVRPVVPVLRHEGEVGLDERRAFNYLIQSTTADLVLERSMAIDRYLSDKKSYISHLIHDEVVIDLCDDEREIVPELKKIFAQNSLDTYEVNVQAGETCYELGVLRL